MKFSITTGQLNELIRQILNALSHLADCNIQYGDLSAKNIVFFVREKRLKLIDLGSSQIVENKDNLNLLCISSLGLLLADLQASMRHHRPSQTHTDSQNMFVKRWRLKISEDEIRSTPFLWADGIGHVKEMILVPFNKDKSVRFGVVFNRTAITATEPLRFGIFQS